MRLLAVVLWRALLYVGGAIALFLALLVLGATDARGDEPGDVRGCMVTYHSNSGSFGFEPFLKVADKESPSEDGEPEVWGFRPWNLEPPREDGKTYPVNILASRFIPLGEFKDVPAGTRTRTLRCPSGLWRDNDE